MQEVPRYPLGLTVVSGLRVLVAGGAVAVVIAGCSGSTSPNTGPAARVVKMASFSGGGLSFRYPAAWTAKRRLLMTTSESTDIVFLTQARLHNPCKRSTNAYGGVGISCQGGVLNALPAGDVFIRWSLLGSGPYPAAGKHQVIDGHQAIVTTRDTHVCGMRGVQASIAAAISTGTGNWYQMQACLRSPGLHQAEAEVRAMLRSVRLRETG